METKKIILASSSPRRQALMEQAGFPFTVRISQVEEKIDQDSPSGLVEALSAQKAVAVLKELESEVDGEDAVIIGADTLVSLQGRTLGKPSDEQEAFSMLKMLQGKKHTVYTGMTLIYKSKDGHRIKSLVDSAHVFMRALADNEIWAYIKTGEPLDKAGAYGVQGKGALWIERIEGDYYTVMGLPLTKLYSALQEIHIEPVKYWE